MEKKISFIELIQVFIDKGDIVLPVFSTAAMRVQQELVKKELEMKKIVNIISGDQSLSSQVLQTANSAFYRGLVEVATVHAAVIRLGAQEVGRICLLASTKNQFRSKDKEHMRIMKKLWQHSVGCAMGARWLAKRCELTDLENHSFFAGLFHDVGKLFVLMIIEQMKRKNKKIRTTSALLAEAMDSLHPEQGYKLMQNWNLPERYCIVARDHHIRDFDQKNFLLMIVRLSDLMCKKLGIGLIKEPNMVIASSEEAQILNVSEIDLAELEVMLEDSKALTS